MFASRNTSSTKSKTYVDDVFSAYTYEGTSAVQSINNGINLAGKGGLVWTKSRNTSRFNKLVDTLRGVGTNGGFALSSNATSAQQEDWYGLTGFTTNGYTLGNDTGGGLAYNSTTPDSYVSWTFRKAPKFFDVVTYTGNGAAGRSIPHNLGSVPGIIIVKSTNTAEQWITYHRSLGATNFLELQSTAASASASTIWQDTTPTASVFTVGAGSGVNTNGTSYVAYLFAHDTSADGLIQCGSFTTDASGNPVTLSLGWEPQFLLVKASSVAGGSWRMLDTLRGWNNSASDAILSANLGDAETFAEFGEPTPSGAVIRGFQANVTFVYMAIRRPNKPPTSGTQVYNAIARNGTGAAATVTGVGFAPDYVIAKGRTGGYLPVHFDRLRGAGKYLASSATSAEVTDAPSLSGFDVMDGVALGTDAATGYINLSSVTYINHFFRRAPGFMDVVCYTGTGIARTVPHSLTVAPELMIVKSRSGAANWGGYHTAVQATKNVFLNDPGVPVASSTYWNDTAPTSANFTVNNNAVSNSNAVTYVAYLFASLPGISKVFNYTGNGTSQTIPCGFSNGARFVLIKRTDAAGDWFVWDTVRGIVAGNDPHLNLNTAVAEVTTNDSIDPDASGFIVNQLAATNINVNAATYIGLAIA